MEQIKRVVLMQVPVRQGNMHGQVLTLKPVPMTMTIHIHCGTLVIFARLKRANIMSHVTMTVASQIVPIGLTTIIALIAMIRDGAH